MSSHFPKTRDEMFKQAKEISATSNVGVSPTPKYNSEEKEEVGGYGMAWAFNAGKKAGRKEILDSLKKKLLALIDEKEIKISKDKISLYFKIVKIIEEMEKSE